MRHFSVHSLSSSSSSGGYAPPFADIVQVVSPNSPGKALAVREPSLRIAACKAAYLRHAGTAARLHGCDAQYAAAQITATEAAKAADEACNALACAVRARYDADRALKRAHSRRRFSLFGSISKLQLAADAANRAADDAEYAVLKKSSASASATAHAATLRGDANSLAKARRLQMEALDAAFSGSDGLCEDRTLPAAYARSQNAAATAQARLRHAENVLGELEGAEGELRKALYYLVDDKTRAAADEDVNDRNVRAVADKGPGARLNAATACVCNARRKWRAVLVLAPELSLSKETFARQALLNAFVEVATMKKRGGMAGLLVSSKFHEMAAGRVSDAIDALVESLEEQREKTDDLEAVYVKACDRTNALCDALFRRRATALMST